MRKMEPAGSRFAREDTSKLLSPVSFLVLLGQIVPMLLVPASPLRAQQESEPCVEVFLTGTGAGPAPQFGNAQAGVFVRYGTVSDGCNLVRIQFDAGRGTLLNLSLIDAPESPGFVTPQSLDALFLTHGHSDHTSSLPDVLETRWILVKNDGQFDPTSPPFGRYKPLPVFCLGITCDIVRKATVPWQEFEIPSRKDSDMRLSTPEAAVMEFVASAKPGTIWQSNKVTVSTVAVDHIEGSAGYLVETPAGDICISGDTAISNNLIDMCRNAELVIHDVIHPVVNDIISNPPKSDPKFIEVLRRIYRSHASAEDIQAFGNTGAVVLLTHMTPPIGVGGFQGIPLSPYLKARYPGRKTGPMAASDYCQAVADGGFAGQIHVGRDLTKAKLANNLVSITSRDSTPTDCNQVMPPENTGKSGK